MARALLELPQALEIRHRRRQVLDANAEQCRHGDAEELGELVERLDLRQLALLEAVERGTRDVEALRDFVGAQPRGEAEGLQPVADVVEANRHQAAAGFFLSAPLTTQLYRYTTSQPTMPIASSASGATA